MKQIIITCAIAITFTAFTACKQSGNTTSSKGSNATDSLINTAGTLAATEVKTGAQLVTSNDCFTCHSIDSVVKGPAFKTIAQKYNHLEGVISNLSRSIISGSRGIWGTEEMTPHPTVTPAEAREMIQYIFSLDSTHTADTTGTYGGIKYRTTK